MKLENIRTLCDYYNEIVYKINQLTEMCGNTDEAIKLRDDLFDMFTVKFSEPLDDIAELQEELGCPLDVVFKAAAQKKVFAGTCWLGNLCLEKIDNVWWLTNGWTAYSVRLKDYKKTWWLKEDKSE